MSTRRIRWGDRQWLELLAGDRLEVRVHFRNAGSVAPPRGLEVESVLIGGEEHLITYEAHVTLAFHTDRLFPDPYFDSYRADLQAFYDYRDRILTGKIGRAHRPAVRAPLVHGTEPDT